MPVWPGLWSELLAAAERPWRWLHATVPCHVLPDRRTQFWKTDLTGADLWDATLSRAKLAGATADQLTRWPPGFDARAAGVIVA
jgi:hypothetical protein